MYVYFMYFRFLLLNVYPFQTQEVERIGKIKCKYNGDAIHFTLKKTSTLKELIGMVEQQWGEGKGVKFKDEDGDWVIMNTNDDVVEVWKQTKIGNVSVKVFITQQNQVFFLFIYIINIIF